MRMLKKTVNNILASLFNIKVVRAKKKAKSPPFLDVEHPLEAHYINKGFPFVMNLPMDKCRVWRWFPTTTDSLCPFTVCAKAYLRDKIGLEDIKKIITTYARSIPKHDGNAALGLNEMHKVFPDGEHNQKITFPWLKTEPGKFYETWYKSTSAENKIHGHNKLDFLGSGVTSEEKIKIEAKRTFSLIKSLIKSGYVFRPDDCIGGVILIDKNGWKWYVNGGQHRAAILAAMGLSQIPIRVDQIVRKDEVVYWPNVKSGLFTKQAALQVFDRMFEADPPPVFDRWIHAVKTNKLY